MFLEFEVLENSCQKKNQIFLTDVPSIPVGVSVLCALKESHYLLLLLSVAAFIFIFCLFSFSYAFVILYLYH